MSAIWAVFLARLLDPVGALIGLTIGAFVRSRWGIAIGAVVAAAVTQILLYRLGRIEGFAVGPFVAGLLAFALWAALGNLVFRRLMGRAR